MKTLFAAAAVIASLAGAGPVSAQMAQPPAAISGAPSWTRDDGSSSDHPIHNPGDVSGDRLNREYQGGMTVPPGQGFPAMGNQR